MATPHRTRTAGRRDGAETRALVRRIALRLFTEQGYEATSLRQIADELGINKASLYYYFDSKEAILQSLFDERGVEAEQLVTWLREQPRTPALLTTAVLRWVDSFTAEKLQGIRFMSANPLLARTLTSGPDGNRIGASLNHFVDELTTLLPDPSPQNVLLLRMAVLSINAAVQAAPSTDPGDEVVIAVARRAARAALSEITN
ncbi:TetR family transcriptional regulator [Actinoplanes sp. SE50]|uniref:TetR/AcrR family transcriptional regulator n=1 Tax=unclassified Actinoplanes TaxID=2626549 RepID=UPI00023EBD3F|nr:MULTISPECIES: TetR/AcrR family transcriptional regulator [unclassified Actinoplanes]AEV84528.1 TetR family transcriptional regulator [Actinoplanes sp. SE50/110]ATO82920.1 TetR family transcriptional regulator [Actinoplanes sp. SE50]SLM00328.1 TetR family transcriptional regulator [Actinoplanes sp. SE50/110]